MFKLFDLGFVGDSMRAEKSLDVLIFMHPTLEMFDGWKEATDGIYDRLFPIRSNQDALCFL